MRRGVTLGIGCAVNRDKPRMHGMGGPASTGARGHEITVNAHLLDIWAIVRGTGGTF